MEENDVIAEYIRTKYPELLTSVDFAIFKISKVLVGCLDAVKETFGKIDFEEIKKITNENKQERED